MGLGIKSYRYSYGTLHELRAFALKVEGNKRKLRCALDKNACGKCLYCLYDKGKDPLTLTMFSEFVLHSDCDGGYKLFPTDKDREKGWGDLLALKEEVCYLNCFTSRLDSAPLKAAWQAFYNDVMHYKCRLRFS